MAEDKPGSPERKCKAYNVIMAVINLLALTAALGIKSALYGAAFPSWPLVLADGSSEYLAVSLETGGISPAAPPGGGK